MQTSKLKIHCFDDVAEAAQYVKISICPYHNKSRKYRIQWTEENVSYKRFQAVGEAIAYYEETNDYPDLISIDIDSRELHESFKLSDKQIGIIPTKYLGEERTSTRGKSLLAYIIEKYPNCAVLYFTGQIHVSEVVKEVINAERRGVESVVTKADKGKGIFELQDMIVSKLKQVAKNYFNKLDSSIKKELKHELFSLDKEDFLLFKVNVDKKEYQLKDILIAYLPLEENEFKAEIGKLLTPDITLAASEVFGIFGVKQITHEAPDYFPYNNTGELKEEISRQFNGFEQLIKDVKETQNNIFGNTTFEEHYKEFKQTILTNEIASHIADINLQSERDKKFRYGSVSRKNTRITIVLNGAEPTDLPVELINDVDKFEINLPIHLIFKNCLERILSAASNENKFYLCSFRDEKKAMYHPIKGNNIPNKPSFFFNYLLMPSKNIFELNLSNLPDHIKCLWEKNFGYFGEYYLAIKNNTGWNIFNSTWKDNIYCIELDNIIPNSCILNHFIIDNKILQTIHIFRFNTWNQ
jgi:hypothetical protein